MCVANLLNISSDFSNNPVVGFHHGIGNSSAPFNGTNRKCPGLDQAFAAVRDGDTLVVPKLDRLARSVPDARTIADQHEKKGVKLALGASLL
ncbi:MAG: DNA invertase Pin-like site-specific DNA recombinase [Yoonia sp.]